MENRDFLQAFLNHRTMLFAFIHAMIRDPHGTEDVFQETSMALFRDANKFNAGDDFGVWARSVARNRIKAYFRKNKRDRHLSAEAEVAILGAHNQIDEDWWRERMEALGHCMEKLGTMARTLLQKFYGEGLSTEAIAGKADMTPTAVRIALCRTRKALRSCVENRMRRPS